MARNTSIIPKAPCGRILQKAGASRVSDEATTTFSEVIEDLANSIAEKAVRIAEHSGRKTVLEGDIKIAVK